MAVSVSSVQAKIVRTVKMSFRKTRHANFSKPDGWLICDAWFEDGEPQIQIRSLVDRLEDAEIVAVGIRVAIDWLVEETARGGNVPQFEPTTREEK